MPSPLPSSVPFLVIGAGVHGLSTAWHLAQRGEQRAGVDKAGVAAGASGIACGVVRNNYFQPAMSELMAACMDIWESDPEAFTYHGSGYVALGPAGAGARPRRGAERHERIGYPSELICGEAAVAEHMRTMFPDWRAKGLTVCLHERRGGFAFNRESMLALAAKARAAGAEIAEGVEVTGFERDGDGAVTRVRTRAGDIAAEQVVVAVGPWIPACGRCWGCRPASTCGSPTGASPRRPDVDVLVPAGGRDRRRPGTLACADGSPPPVLHVDSDAPLYDDDGRLVTDEPWGNYFKPDRESVQGGARPDPSARSSRSTRIPTGTVDPGFPDMWSASLSHCLERFTGARKRYRQVRSGGVGAFTADNFPVFDYMAPNVYVAADSNHGYKMIAVGREIADVLCGGHSSLLHPFRYERFATGDLHPVSHSPYPWS